MAETIPFPFVPYPQQQDLMRSIVECVEASSVGCFESPTGTGKSLSAICATLNWQFKEEKRILDEQQALGLKSSTGTCDDWLMAFQSNFVNDTAESKKKKKSYDLHLAMKARVLRASTSTLRQQGLVQLSGRKSLSVAESRRNSDDDNQLRGMKQELEDEFSLRHYDSDDERSRQSVSGNKNKSVRNLNDDSDSEEENEGTAALCLPKIFYCSRTHSQISQFVSEIKSTAFANARCVTLGSRRNMCINPDVMIIGSDTTMSEVCLEMHKSKVKSTANIANERGPSSRKQKTTVSDLKPCPFHNKQKELRFADHALAKIRDIESLTSLGDELAACPYYATRRAVRDAQVVCMPYNMLLLDDLRESIGIDLANSVVIFDEAHNLVEAVNHIYSADVTHDQLVLASQCVGDYSLRFQSVLTGKNYYYVNILLSVINGLKNCLKVEKRRDFAAPKSAATTDALDGALQTSLDINSAKNPGSAAPATTSKAVDASMSTDVLGTNDFMFRCGLDNVNMFKLRRHMTETNLAKKVGGYADHEAKRKAVAAAELLAASVTIKPKNSRKGPQCSDDRAPCCSSEEDPAKVISGSYVQALRSVLMLITCLTNADLDGRIVVTKYLSNLAPAAESHPSPCPSPAIKFILLNPSVHFQKVVDQARSVLLLGGTLQPFSYVKSFLFPKVPLDKISLFSCGHVVSKSNVLAVVAHTGPRGGALEFTHTTRMHQSPLVELHSSLKAISSTVPHGVVVFFSSYQYMGAVLAKWCAMGIYDELTATRPLFSEPRLAADAEAVWLEYSQRAVQSRGAMLFCVMGGKLSEGINFSDKLARCVVVIGMPYPDGRDTVLQEKLKFACLVEKDEKAGKRLYEAMCMRTVNQCIGRSIRHVNDYAAIVLLDCRYSQARVSSQLPVWLSSEIVHCKTFPEVQSKLNNFFSSFPE